MIVVAILAGVLLAAGYVAIGRRGGDREPALLALGLFLAAFVYVVFAVVGGAPAEAILIEMVGLALYGFLAWSGTHRHVLYLAAGWLLHVAWDAVLHLGSTTGAEYTPAWYPWLCIGFDLAVAAYAAHLGGLFNRK